MTRSVTYRYIFMNYDLLSPSYFKSYDSEYIGYIVGYDIYSTSFNRNAHSFCRGKWMIVALNQFTDSLTRLGVDLKTNWLVDSENRESTPFKGLTWLILYSLPQSNCYRSQKCYNRGFESSSLNLLILFTKNHSDSHTDCIIGVFWVFCVIQWTDLFKNRSWLKHHNNTKLFFFFFIFNKLNNHNRR